MPICAKLVEVNGESFLALDPAQTNFSACTYVVESGDEVASSFFRMSAQDGGFFSAGLITCWLTAFGIKQIIQILKGSSHE